MGRLFLLAVALLFALCILDTTVCAEFTAPPSEAITPVSQPINPIIGPENTPYFLADIQYEISPSYTNVVIAANKKIEFIYYPLEDPYRIIIDLIGVVFCELEQDLEIKEGPVKSLRIVEDTTVAKAAGLDKYFYAVDYIIVELKEKHPFFAFYSKDGKVIVAQIRAETAPEKIAEKAKMPAEELKQPSPPPKKLEQISPPPKTVSPRPLIIEDVEYEVNPQSSIIAVASNKDLEATIYEQYDPYQIVIAPPSGAFCELEEKMEPMDGLVKFISINKAAPSKEFKAPDKFFYPVKNIVIEPIVQLPFAVHTVDNGRITVVRIEKDMAALEAKEKIEAEEKVKVIEKAETIKEAEIVEKAKVVKEAEVVEGLKEIEAKKISPAAEEKPLTTDEKEEIIGEVTRKLYKKQEELFAREEEKERRKRLIREARDKAKAIRQIEKIGMEELQDLMVKGRGITTLKYCEDIALSYSENAAVAEEEIKLAKMKLRENFRALFPNAKLKGSRTNGDVLGVDFIEQIYGIEAECPIYQGGRLRNAYQQSKINLNLAKARYDKVIHDLNYKVAEAYYSVVTSVMNLKLQQELLEKAKTILKMALKRHSSGLSTDLELFNVKSQYNQVQFQLASAERDLALARFKLEQAMGLDVAQEDIEIGEVETELKFEIVSIDLNKCLELAQEYHPEIIVNNLLVESNEYEKKIARGKDKFKIDLTGFYGMSDSHYETEEEDLDKDWNIGIKISKPFWGNTASYSFTKEETKRKVGQTDRTGSEVHSGEFAILDAMGVASDIQEAQIKKHKSENELLETLRQVNLEVKESYYNYQEAVIQVKNSLEKVRFQKEAVKTAEVQAQLNEALQSQLLEAEIKLADERSLYIKALSDYNFSLIRLNKAIGIEGYFGIEQSGEA